MTPEIAKLEVAIAIERSAWDELLGLPESHVPIFKMRSESAG